ncbi:hypothetical protein CHCC15091_2213 [Bacillus licheniformis]|nr:hypothetical protein CHCC15091_2213 [Bacillus licheniformis]
MFSKQKDIFPAKMSFENIHHYLLGIPSIYLCILVGDDCNRKCAIRTNQNLKTLFEV